MAGTYAANTDVPTSKSRDEVERTLARFGANQFGYATDGDRGLVMVTFAIKGLQIRMMMTLPKRDDYRRNSYGNLRPANAVEKDWEQACRQRWRTLANGIKAKLAMIDDGISTVEREFLGDVVLADGVTIGERIIPQLSEIVQTGQIPGLPERIAPKVIELAERAGGIGR